MADLREKLLEVQERRGQLTPAIVVEEGTPEDSPLHSHFDWNDTTAAHSHRLNQARRMMGSVNVVYREATETESAQRIRFFHPVMEASSPSPVWKSIDQIAEDPIAMEILLRDAARQWQAMRRRFAHLSEFWVMVQQDMPQEEAS